MTLQRAGVAGPPPVALGATMDAKAPLRRVRDQQPTWDKASALAREWQLNKLADRLARMAAES